jgi:hypothetical protein
MGCVEGSGLPVLYIGRTAPNYFTIKETDIVLKVTSFVPVVISRHLGGILCLRHESFYLTS